MNALQLFLLLLAAVSATGVALSRDPLLQALALSFYGIVFGVLFFALQAPDVALSQIVIGAVVLPLMALVSLGRVKAESRKRKKAA